MILHGDNFSIYGGDTSLMLNGIYSGLGNSVLTVDPDGVSPGHVLSINFGGINATQEWRYPLQTGEAATVGIALRMWWPSLPTNNNGQTHVMEWRDLANNLLAYFCVLSTGAVRFGVNQNDDSQLTYDTAIPVVTAEGWYHVEAKYHATGAGLASFEVRVEGVNILSHDNGAARNAFTGQLSGWRANINGDVTHYIKDFVIWNGDGAHNNDFLGSVLVTNLLPESDVDLNWGLTGGATGFEILAGIPPDDEKYIYALHDPAPAGPYVATLSDLPVNTTTVRAVLTFVRAAKTDGGDGSLQMGVISDGDTGLGSNRPITVAETYWRDVFEIDPHTGASWLPSAVNNAEMQINRTT